MESFSERVVRIAVENAKLYKQKYVDFEYLIFSKAFEKKKYYIIDAHADNYQHLIGVQSLISPQEFFNKCFDETLTVYDFTFNKKGQSEKAVKGTVRRKISVLPDMMKLFDTANIEVQEDFEKNKVYCLFATSSDNLFTLGFAGEAKSRPKSLLKGNELNITNSKKIDLVLSKHSTSSKFSEVVMGDIEVLNQYPELTEILDENLFHGNN